MHTNPNSSFDKFIKYCIIQNILNNISQLMTQDQYLTPEGLEKLEQELEGLKEKRKEITDRISEAIKLGDLSENAEYHEAKDAQGLNETRISEIEQILKNAVLINEADAHGQSITIGSKIVIEDNQGNEKEYTIVGSNEADPLKGLISNESPIGEAFMGKQEGDTADVETPSGAVKYKIKKIL